MYILGSTVVMGKVVRGVGVVVFFLVVMVVGAIVLVVMVVVVNTVEDVF